MCRRHVDLFIVLLSVVLCSAFLAAEGKAQSRLGTGFAVNRVNACDFCLAAQGISPLEVGATGLRVDVRYLRLGTMYNDGTQTDNAEKETESHLTQQYSIFFSLDDRFSAAGIVPVARRHAESLAEDGSTVTGDQFGLADVSLLVRYKAFVDHSIESTTILSLAGGVKFPTGRTDGKDSRGDLLDPHIQLGTGSTDFLAGVNGFMTVGRSAIILNLLSGIVTGGAHGHRFGPNLNYEAAYRYKVYPSEYGDTQIFTTISISGEWRGEESQNGVTDGNTGGNVTYLAPGLQLFLTPALSLEGTVQVPLFHGLHGRQLGEDFRVMGGVQILL
jgi:hypothetical protein